MPLDYMLSVLRDESLDPRERMVAANSAAAYLHPKLANIELGNKDGQAFKIILGTHDGGVL